MTNETVIDRRYLMKDDGRLFVWTPELAGRKDMTELVAKNPKPKKNGDKVTIRKPPNARFFKRIDLHHNRKSILLLDT